MYPVKWFLGAAKQKGVKEVSKLNYQVFYTLLQDNPITKTTVTMKGGTLGC